MPGYALSAFSFFAVVIVAGFFGGIMAADRGRNVFLWCVLSALVPPLLLLLYFIKPLREIEGMFRKCAQCGALIKWHASVCKYCQSQQPAQQP